MKTFKSKFRVITGLILIFSFVAQGLFAGDTGKIKIWVSKHFTGGKQCETKKSEWPNPEELFKKKGIVIHDKKRDSWYVCAACGCPAYSFDQYFLINEKDVIKAEGLGFTRGKPPE